MKRRRSYRRRRSLISRKENLKERLRLHQRLVDEIRQLSQRKVQGVWLRTDGKGLWSDQARAVHVTSLVVFPFDRVFGELRVYFYRNSWSVHKHGLIYTDKLFFHELKEILTDLGYSARAIRQLHYSEQGMQGDNYVSFDASGVFVEEFMSKLPSRIVFRIMADEITRRDESGYLFWNRIPRRRRRRRRR